MTQPRAHASATGIAFAAVTSLYFAWGFITSLIDPLVASVRGILGAPQGLSYGQRQSEQMVNKSLSVAAKYIKFRGFVRLDELEVTGSPLVMFHPRSS
ncbi:hypothetical protein [Sphingomonas melonis]|uniref:hypothetical protein n=1 Tax=Sphingomonas melonis TaxID=152682 RepID=UPI000376EE7E|nr:hypothetical protein [Sphingomonas melonis]